MTISGPNTPQFIVHSQSQLDYTPYDCRWVPCSAKLVTIGQHSRGTGALQVYELSDGSHKLIKNVEKTVPIKCCTFGASALQARHLATGDFSGNLSIWDINRLDDNEALFSVQAHDDIINAIDGAGGYGIQCGAPELVTGSRDGNVKVWDTRQQSSPVAHIQPGIGEQSRDCWSVCFGNSFDDHERCVVAGYDNGDVKMFDLRNMSLTWETNVGNGVCGVEFDRGDIKMNKLVVAGLEAAFNVYDLRTQHAEKGFTCMTEKIKQLRSTIWTVRHLPQNREIFVTSGGNGTLNLHQYHYPKSRAQKLEDGTSVGIMGTVELLQYKDIAEQPICAFNWSPDKTGLCCFVGYDQMLRIGMVTRLSQY